MKQEITEERKGYKKTKLGWIPEDWEVDFIEKALLIENNKRKPISQDIRRIMKGEYPYYGPTKIQDYINEYRYDGEYALIAEDGDHFLKYRETSMTQITCGKFNVNNHAHAIKGTNECLTKWFYWYYNRRSVYSHLTRQGAGRYKLNKASLSKLKIAYPKVSEQKEIILLLDTWDKAITTLTQLIAQKQTLKKGLMQRLLTGKQRLSEFEGEWDVFIFSEIAERVSRKNTEGDDTVVTISAQRGFVLQEDFFNKRVASKTLFNYTLVHKGEYCYNKSYSKGYPMGAFKRLDDFEKAVVTTLYICFKLRENVDSDFINHYFESGKMIHGLMRIAQEGGRAHGLLNISLPDFFSLPVKIPKLEEQIAIANVLNTADTEIAGLIAQKEQLELQKKGLMQQLLTGKKRLKVEE